MAGKKPWIHPCPKCGAAMSTYKRIRVCPKCGYRETRIGFGYPKKYRGVKRR